MFNNPLVALDGSTQSERILPLAAAIARSSGAGVNLVEVIGEDAGFDEGDHAVRHLASASARLLQEGLTSHTNVERGNAADEILTEAARVNADVVLMTTHGRGGVKRALLGSVTERVFAESEIPVIAFHDGRDAPGEIGTMLVPMDASLGSAQALNMAKHIAHATHARIELLHVVEPLVRYLRGRYIEPNWEEETRATAERQMDELANSVAQLGYVANGHALVGPPALTIVKKANELAADLIVMTTSGHTGVARAILGSVTDEVLRTADVPVLLIHFNMEEGLQALRETASEAGPRMREPSPSTEVN